MDMLCCALTVDMTDDQLKSAMHKMFRRTQETKQGFLLSISGYANDPRELWEIPESIKFCQKLVDIGFISLLEPAAQIAFPGTPAFGALEVWMIATGQITKKAKYPITQQLMLKLFSVLGETNKKLEKIISEPCPEADIAEMEHIIGRSHHSVPEGQNRRRNDCHFH